MKIDQFDGSDWHYIFDQIFWPTDQYELCEIRVSVLTFFFFNPDINRPHTNVGKYFLMFFYGKNL